VDAGFPFHKVTVLGETKSICSLYNLHESYVNWRLSVLWDSMQRLSWNSVSLPKQWSPKLATLTGQSSVTIAAAVTRRHPNERTPVQCKRDHTDSKNSPGRHSKCLMHSLSIFLRFSSVYALCFYKRDFLYRNLGNQTLHAVSDW